MNATTECDERGRLTLGKSFMERYGRHFAVVALPREVVLIPIPRDPVEALRQEGMKLPKHLKPADLKRIAREEAEKEALNRKKR